MADRREMLESALEEVLEPQDEGKPQEEEHEEMQEEVSQDEPTRNEKGQFVAKDEAVAVLRAVRLQPHLLQYPQRSFPLPPFHL